MQYEKIHATTVVLAAAVAANRLISFGGAYASGAVGAGGSTDCQGVSESEGKIGDAIAVVTGYSYPVEAGGNVTKGGFIKPGADGKAIAGTMADHCGIALADAAAGQLFEAVLRPHVHPTT